MSRQSLTRAEIASLLRGFTDRSEGPSTDGSKEWVTRTSLSRRTPVEYDHSGQQATPDRLGLRSAWRQTGELLSGEFSTLFRVATTTQPEEDQQATQGQFLLCCPDSMCLFRLELEGLTAPWWLTVERALMFSLLDRLLGGPIRQHKGEFRPLSELENRIAGQMVEAVIRAFEAAWPELRVAAPPNETACRLNRAWLTCREPYACCEMVLHLGPVSGRIAAAVPWQIARHAIVLPPDAAAPPTPPPVQVTVVLGQCTVSARDLAQLEVGDLIPTEQRYDQPLDVLVEGGGRYQGRLGSCQGHKAVRIEASSGGPHEEPRHPDHSVNRSRA